MDNQASFWKIVGKRSSVRRYQDIPVPQNFIDKLLDAAKAIAFTEELQQTDYRIVSDPSKIQYIAEEVKRIGTQKIEAISDESLRKNTLSYSSSFFWFGKAPALLAVSCRKTPDYMKYLAKRHSDDLFGAKAVSAMAAQNIMLAATALGLGACCLTGPLVAKSWLEKELGCPEQHELVLLISLGFPAQKTRSLS